MLKIGITGCNGFIGWHLYQYLNLFNNNYSIIPINEEHFNDFEKLIDKVKGCDVIVHLAGVNRHFDQRFIFQKNIELVDKLIEACKVVKNKAHIIFSSSTQEDKNNIYGNSKKEARLKLISWAKANKSKFTGLIIPNVFGPFGKPFYNSVISTFSYQLATGQEPKIEIDANLNLIYVSELTQIIKNFIDYQSEDIIEEFRVQHTYSLKVSDILLKLINFKEEYLKDGTIPNLENKFDINLFNTFRSYINLTDFYPFKYKINSDNRGIFVETMKSKVGGQVSFSTTKPGVTRGNHFHTRKIERFAVIKGKALIQLRKIGTDEIFSFYLDGQEPSFIDMPIWFTHNITNVGNDELLTIFWINEFFNPEDPDTFFEPVVF